MQSTYSFDHSTHAYTIFSLEAALIPKKPGQAQARICCCQGDYKQTVSVFTWGRFKCKSPTPLYVDHFYWYLRSQINNTKKKKSPTYSCKLLLH